MGFSVPPRLRLERWALTPPFHPYRPQLVRARVGGLFSVALSIGTPHGVAFRVCLRLNRSYAASRPMVFGLSSPLPQSRKGAILRPSKIEVNVGDLLVKRKNCSFPLFPGGASHL